MVKTHHDCDNFNILMAVSAFFHPIFGYLVVSSPPWWTVEATAVDENPLVTLAPCGRCVCSSSPTRHWQHLRFLAQWEISRDANKNWLPQEAYKQFCCSHHLPEYTLGLHSARYLNFRKAATCSHSQPLEWPQVAAFPEWPQVAASGRFSRLAASGRLYHITSWIRNWGKHPLAAAGSLPIHLNLKKNTFPTKHIFSRCSKTIAKKHSLTLTKTGKNTQSQPPAAYPSISTWKKNTFPTKHLFSRCSLEKKKSD